MKSPNQKKYEKLLKNFLKVHDFINVKDYFFYDDYISVKFYNEGRMFIFYSLLDWYDYVENE